MVSVVQNDEGACPLFGKKRVGGTQQVKSDPRRQLRPLGPRPDKPRHELARQIAGDCRTRQSARIK